MSPVSRKRKSKKTRRPPRSTGNRAAVFGLSPAAISWWPDRIAEVFDGADALLAADRPRQLEQATAELIGGVLYRALTEQRMGFALLAFLDALIDQAATQPTLATWYLLHGIAAIAPRPQATHARQVIDRMGADGLTGPAWLSITPTVRPTGEVRLLRDAYGGRFGVLITCRYPDPDTVTPAGGADEHVFLIDVDTCSSIVEVVDASVHNGPADAADAWRASVGAPAAAAEPAPVDAALLADLLPTPGTGDLGVMGGETRRRMDNYYRVLRRSDDLAQGTGHRRPAATHRIPVAGAGPRWAARRQLRRGVPRLVPHRRRPGRPGRGSGIGRDLAGGHPARDQTVLLPAPRPQPAGTDRHRMARRTAGRAGRRAASPLDALVRVPHRPRPTADRPIPRRGTTRPTRVDTHPGRGTRRRARTRVNPHPGHHHDNDEFPQLGHRVTPPPTRISSRPRPDGRRYGGDHPTTGCHEGRAPHDHVSGHAAAGSPPAGSVSGGSCRVSNPQPRRRDMSTSTPADSMSSPTDAEQPTCWCCGATRPEIDLVRLGAHPEVGICIECASFLHRRARAAHATVVSGWLHATGDRIREAVMARQWQNHPRVGPPLRWLNRHLPW